MPRTDTGNTRREKVFLALLRYAESNQREDPNAYHVRNGGGTFANLRAHPGPEKPGEGSSGSGAYQITWPTYQDAVRLGVAHSFYEPDQDAIALYDMRHALPTIHSRQLDAAYAMSNRKRTSRPGGSEQHIDSKAATSYFSAYLKDHP